MNPSIGCQLAQYRELQVLWADEERLFYRGWQPGDDGGQRAILVVLPAAAPPSPLAVDRLAHEFGLKEALDGEWALRPLALNRDGERPALVLHDPGGEPLSQLLSAPIPVGEFLSIAISIAAALRRFHQRGLVHKDIKPANIFVDRSSGRVWLTGFGIASRLARERQSPEPPETIAGTLAYMAPEQTGRMNRSIDTRSDLYALGVTFCQMLTGVLPFVAADPMEWVHCHIARRPVPPSERRSDVPPALCAIVMKLLAKTAEDRYQTATGVERDLRRCLADWEAESRIDDFSLGQQDTPDTLRIPEKLYGRDAEVETLLAAFDRIVNGGAPELLLVAGYSGIGKSSVVNELHKVLVPPRGLFASGKFDQYKRDIPYSTLAQAFQGLVRSLLSKSDTELASWRQELISALGQNGQLMIDLVPDLQLIIGEQPPLSDLPSQQAQIRFQLTFRRFISVFARPEHPLTLFFDDLQWLDATTLDLLEDLLTRSDLRNFLVIGAYRDNEVTATHPLALRLRAIRVAGVAVKEIPLGPFTRGHLAQLMADTFRCGSEQVGPLAELVHEKTGGNPFFAVQFLSELVEEGLLRFDHEDAGWAWDLTSIHAKGYTDNVVSLMVCKLTRLPDRTQRAVQQLACIGNAAAIEMLAIAFAMSEEQVHTDLWEAVRLELVQRQQGSYKFVHDRVHEAAYSLIPTASRVPAHLRIGRLLAAKTSPEKREETIFEIVNQLNRGAELITERSEREQLVELNLIAGKRAKDSTAYAAAREYLAQATNLLSPVDWAQHYERTFDLYLAFSECEYLAGNFAAADALFDLIIEGARSNLDRAKAYSLRIKLYQVAGKYDEGLAVALDAIQLFGLIFPDSEQDIQTAVAAGLSEIPNILGERSIGSLVDAPAAIDPVMWATINLLVDAVPCAYIARPALFPLITLKAVHLSMVHGNTDQSSFAYGVYSIWLVSAVADIDTAFQFSEMSLRLNDKFDNAHLRGTLLHLHGDHVNFWRRPFATGIPILEEAFRACIEVGDFVYAGFLAFETVWQHIEKGEALEQVLEQSAKYAAFARQSHNNAVHETIRLEQQFVASLQGRTSDPLSFDADGFDEAASFASIVEATFGCGIVFYHLMKQMLAFLYSRHADALEAAERAEPVLGAAMAMPIEATYHFFHALTLTALYPAASATEQQSYRLIIEEKAKKLEFWAGHCPENYRYRHALVAAEIARLDGRDADSMRLFEEAIRSARAGGFIHGEALSYELAAQFYAARDFEQVADLYLRSARTCYARWGAEGKVRQLDERYPQLSKADPMFAPSGTMDTAVDQLDLATVVKMSLAVSSEINLEKLLDTLMRTALEQAGAVRAVLILLQSGQARIRAEAFVSNQETSVRLTDKPTDEGALPLTVLHYSMRTKESVILNDAALRGPFSDDAYVRAQRTRSLLCVPLINRGHLTGAIYLENNLTPDVFVQGRIALLKLLASQAAISLENTRLYRDLELREARIRRLVDANIIGIFIWDSEGRILEANDAFLGLVGYSREELEAGRLHWTEVNAPEWRDFTKRLLSSQVRTTGSALPHEKEYLRKDGSRVPVLVGLARFDDNVNQGVAFVLDLSERKRVEADARESDRRYREGQMELAHANRVAVMGQLTASIAHEVKQPIAASVANAAAALRFLSNDRPDIEEVREALDTIVSDGNRAADIVSRIQDHIKKAPPRKEHVEINDAILKVVELTRSETLKNDVLMRTELADGLPLVHADRVQLQQVILNLIINAVEALNGARRREVLLRTITSETGDVIVSVSDSGPGLAPAAINQIFDAFYTTKQSGFGLGLSICRSIIEAHGGTICADDNGLEGGARITFMLPADATNVSPLR